MTTRLARLAPYTRAFQPAAVADQGLPDGVLGRVEGFALVYDELDERGTMFARGCLVRTVRERVAAGKVKLFWDHGDAIDTGFYDTDLHIGTVRSLVDRQLPDGRWGAYMVADIMATDEGGKAYQYLKSVVASGGETGLSIGMLRGMKGEKATVDGRQVMRFTEVALREISVTAEQSVPDSLVTSVRQGRREVLEVTLGGIIAALGVDAVRAACDAHAGDSSQDGNASDGPDSDAPDATSASGDSDAGGGDSHADGDGQADTRTAHASMEERLAALRATYANR